MPNKTTSPWSARTFAVRPRSTNRGRGPSPMAAGTSKTRIPAARPIQEPAEIDANFFIFALCRQLQMTYLDRRGIDCLVDVEGVGRLPASVCRMLGLVVAELVTGAGECPQLETTPREIAVTLRRRGATCLCTVACRGLRGACTDRQPGVQRLRHLAAEFDGGCAVRAMPERATVAVMVDVGLVARDFPAAIWRHRANEAVRSPHRRSPAVLK